MAIVGTDNNNNLASGSTSVQQAYGLSGNDSIYTLGSIGTPGSYPLESFGGPGNDWIDLRTSTYNSSLYGEAGADVIQGSSNANYIEGGEGNDALYGFAGNDVIYGGDGNESANESISAGSGIAADGRSNTITSPGGLYGGAGDDYLDGGRGDDYLVGDDEINPAIVGNDTLYGGSGLNTLIGGQGDDVIYSGGLDSAAGGPGNDIIWGVTDVGGSTYYGGSGNDIMASWKSSTFFGEAGNDTIFGSQESDSIYGGPGTDALAGYAGTDYLSGGGDRDLFNMWFDVRAGDVDFITDWNEGGGASDMLGLNTVFNGSVQYTQGTGFVDVALPIGAGFYHIYVLGSGVTAANVQANTYFVSV